MYKRGWPKLYASQVAVLLFLPGGVGCAFAASYYVAPTGLDTNPGTPARPWKTVQKAADTLAPGDTVYVHTGTYGPVTVHVSGSASGGFITFRNFPGETPVVDGSGCEPPRDDDAGLFLLTESSYIVISGFELRNYKTTNPQPVPAGIFLRGACAHVRILRCNIHDIANTGGTMEHAGNAFGLAVYGSSIRPATDIIIDGNEIHHLQTGASESLSLNGNVTNFQVSHNRVHDNNNIGISFIGFEQTCPDAAQDQARDGVCRDNAVWNISSQHNQAYRDGDYSADGLYCDGATRVTLERNISHDNDIGVELSSEHEGKLTSKIILRDNCFYFNREGGVSSAGTPGIIPAARPTAPSWETLFITTTRGAKATARRRFVFALPSARSTRISSTEMDKIRW